MKNIMLLILLIIGKVQFAQTVYFKHFVQVDINNCFINSYNSKDSSVSFSILNGNSYDFKIFNVTPYKSFDFVFKTLNRDTIITGQYSIDDKVSIGYGLGRRINNKRKPTRIKILYYKSHRIGKWQYFDNNGTLLKEENY